MIRIILTIGIISLLLSQQEKLKRSKEVKKYDVSQHAEIEESVIKYDFNFHINKGQEFCIITKEQSDYRVGLDGASSTLDISVYKSKNQKLIEKLWENEYNYSYIEAKSDFVILSDDPRAMFSFLYLNILTGKIIFRNESFQNKEIEFKDNFIVSTGTFLDISFNPPKFKDKVYDRSILLTSNNSALQRFYIYKTLDLKNTNQQLSFKFNKSNSLELFVGKDKFYIPFLNNRLNLTLTDKNSANSYFLISAEIDSKDKYLLNERFKEIDKLDGKQLRLLRNEIFARHGYVFKDKKLANYFQSKEWYAPIKNIIISTDDFTVNEINTYNLIRKAELLLK